MIPTITKIAIVPTKTFVPAWVERLVKKLGVLLTSHVSQISKKTAPAIINPKYSDDQTPDVIPAIAPATVKKTPGR